MEKEMEIRGGNKSYFQFISAIFGMFRTGKTRAREIHLISYFLFPVSYMLFKLVCFVYNWKAEIRTKATYVPVSNKSSVCNTYTMNAQDWNMEVVRMGMGWRKLPPPPIPPAFTIHARIPSVVEIDRRRKNNV